MRSEAVADSSIAFDEGSFVLPVIFVQRSFARLDAGKVSRRVVAIGQSRSVQSESFNPPYRTRIHAPSPRRRHSI